MTSPNVGSPPIAPMVIRSSVKSSPSSGKVNSLAVTGLVFGIIAGGVLLLSASPAGAEAVNPHSNDPIAALAEGIFLTLLRWIMAIIVSFLSFTTALILGIIAVVRANQLNRHNQFLNNVEGVPLNEPVGQPDFLDRAIRFNFSSYPFSILLLCVSMLCSIIPWFLVLLL